MGRAGAHLRDALLLTGSVTDAEVWRRGSTVEEMLGTTTSVVARFAAKASMRARCDGDWTQRQTAEQDTRARWDDLGCGVVAIVAAGGTRVLRRVVALRDAGQGVQKTARQGQRVQAQPRTARASWCGGSQRVRCRARREPRPNACDLTMTTHRLSPPPTLSPWTHCNDSVRPNGGRTGKESAIDAERRSWVSEGGRPRIQQS